MATPGIRKRHSRSCTSRDDRDCNCRPSWEARVWSRRAGPDGKGGTISRSFPTYAAAKGWKEDASHANRRGKLRPQTRQTVREAAEALIIAMKDGSVLSSRDRPYKPSTIRGYERALGIWPEQRQRAPRRLLDAFGDWRLSELDRHAIQRYANLLRADGWDASTVHNQLDPLRVIYRVARDRDEVAVDPLERLKLAKPTGRRDRIAPPAEAQKLLDALPDAHRAVWATAFFAGLRRGELRALRVSDIDLAAGVIRVRHGWDDEEGEQDGKTDNADRQIPIVGALRGELLRHLARTGRRGGDLTFGRTPDEPFIPSTVRRESNAAWDQAGLTRITFHESRHTFASLMSAAGVELKALSQWMGHGSIQITYDRYSHLYPDARERAVRQADTFLAAQAGGLRAVD
jgi:integrase